MPENTFSGNSESRRVLSTWQEVAFYLGVTLRTAQNWERLRGLPVHRVEGAKARIWAYKDELDEWKESAVAGQASDPEPEHRSSWRLRMTVAACLVTAAAVTYLTLRPGQPVRYVEQGSALQAFDAKGREVWRLDLPVAPAPEDLAGASSAERSHGFFTDLDGDGRAELIYHYLVPGLQRIRSSVLCVGSDGKVRWKFQPGGAIADLRGHRFSDEWSPAFAGVLRKPRADGGVVIVASHHMFSWPGQVVALTAQGKHVAEYWHPGWLLTGVTHDLDDDGTEEVILGGVNDGYSGERYQAGLLVLGRDFKSGQSKGAEGDHRQIAGVPVVAEDALVLFPKLPFPGPAGPTWRVDSISAGDALVVRVTGMPSLEATVTSLHFRFDRHLRCKEVIRNMEFDRFYVERLPGQGGLGERVSAALTAVKTPRNRFAE